MQIFFNKIFFNKLITNQEILDSNFAHFYPADLVKIADEAEQIVGPIFAGRAKIRERIGKGMRLWPFEFKTELRNWTATRRSFLIEAAEKPLLMSPMGIEGSGKEWKGGRGVVDLMNDD